LDHRCGTKIYVYKIEDDKDVEVSIMNLEDEEVSLLVTNQNLEAKKLIRKCFTEILLLSLFYSELCHFPLRVAF